VRQASDDDTLVGLNPIPDAPREILYAGPACVARAGDDLILEGVCSDAVQRGANLKNEPVAEALFARFVVVLRALDVRFCERSNANRAAQGAG